uniref:Uncharacterized protein n=1 Tax=Spironucleus salmonicida TaxID=348837 RepID=V6LQN8_9EUKA|eukprot:EST43069.1 Hypothetical protein SS50377_17226 [Spironucleus salmonicida]
MARPSRAPRKTSISRIPIARSAQVVNVSALRRSCFGQVRTGEDANWAVDGKLGLKDTRGDCMAHGTLSPQFCAGNGIGCCYRSPAYARDMRDMRGLLVLHDCPEQILGFQAT